MNEFENNEVGKVTKIGIILGKKKISKILLEF